MQETIRCSWFIFTPIVPFTNISVWLPISIFNPIQIYITFKWNKHVVFIQASFRQSRSRFWIIYVLGNRIETKQIKTERPTWYAFFFLYCIKTSSFVAPGTSVHIFALKVLINYLTCFGGIFTANICSTRHIVFLKRLCLNFNFKCLKFHRNKRLIFKIMLENEKNCFIFIKCIIFSKNISYILLRPSVLTIYLQLDIFK